MMMKNLTIKWHASWFNFHSIQFADALDQKVKDHHRSRMMYHLKKSYWRNK